MLFLHVKIKIRPTLIYKIMLRKYFEQRPLEFVSRIKLPGSSSKSLICILDYLYTGQLKIKPANLRDLVFSARELGIGINDDLMESIGYFLMENSDRMESLQALELARLLGLRSFYNRLLDEICANFNSSITSEAFLHLSSSTLYELVSKSLLLFDRDEALLLKQIAIWLGFKWDTLGHNGNPSRQVWLLRLFSKIRISSENLDDLEQVLKHDHKILSQIRTILRLVKNI